MPNRTLAESTRKGVVIIILTMSLTYILVAAIRLNDVPNSNLRDVSLKNQEMLKQHTDILRKNTEIFRDNARKLDMIYKDLQDEKARRSGHEAKAQ